MDNVIGLIDVALSDDSSENERSRMTVATHVHYRVLAAGCALALIAYVHRQAFVGATPEIKDALGLTAEQMGNVAAAFLLAYGIFQIPCGIIGDRFGARHLLTALVLGWSLLTGLTALTGTVTAGRFGPFLFLLGTRFLFGGFQAGAFPVWSRVMTDWMPVRERASGQGMIWMFSRLGGAASPLVFFWLFQLFDTWTTPLWVLGTLGVLWCAMFWPWFRNQPEQMPRVSAAERELINSGRATTMTTAGPIPWLALLSSVNVWALCLMYGCVGFAGNFTTNMLPIYLADERGMAPELVKQLSGLPLAFGIGSCLVGGLLSDWISRRWDNRKWGRRLNGSVGLALAGAGFLAVPWAQTTWLLALLFSASFFMNDLNIAPAWAACADVGERFAGTISGAMNMVGQFGGAIGMSFAGYMLQRGNSKTLFIIFACSYALAALCWLAIDVTRPLGQRRAASTIDMAQC
jgi:sugar phosphate permease